MNGYQRAGMQDKSSAVRQSKETKVLARCFFCLVAGYFFCFSFQSTPVWVVIGSLMTAGSQMA